MEEVLQKKKVMGMPKLRFPVKTPIAFCQGCHHPFLIRILSDVVDELGIEGDTVMAAGVGCHPIVCALLNLDVFIPAAAHGRAPDVASGVKRTLGKKSVVITVQGDGDAMAIGTESLIQAAARGERITVIMLNNQVYGTTGGQMSPTTMMGVKTPTSPRGRQPQDGYPIQTAELLATMPGVAFSARGELTSVKAFNRTKKLVKQAIQKQMDDVGFSFVEILSACPTNWGMPPVKCIDYIKDELMTVYPIGTFKDVDKTN